MKEKKQSDVLISSDQLLLYGIFFMFCANLVFMSSYYELIGYSCYAIGCSIIYLYLLAYPLKNRSFSNMKFLIWYILFLLVMFLSTFYTIYPSESRHLIWVIARVQIPTVIGILLYANNQYKIDKLMKAYLIASIILAVVVIKDGPIGINNSRYGWSVTGEQPNTPAMNLAAATAFSLFYFLKHNRIGTRILYLILSVFFTLVIFLTGSRKILIYIVGLIFLYVMSKTTNFKKFIIGSLGTIILLFIAYWALNSIPLLYNAIGNRIFVDLDTEGSAVERNYLRETAYHYFLESPFWGYGLDSFRYMNNVNRYAHNNYLELLVSTGLIGTIVYYSIMITSLKQLYKHKKNMYSFLFLSVLIMTLVIEYYNVNYLQRGIYIVYALAFCQSRILLEEKKTI